MVPFPQGPLHRDLRDALKTWLLKTGFTSNRIIAGVVIRSVEWYVIRKIKTTESHVHAGSVKTLLSESEYTNHNVRFQALWLVGFSASPSDSDNLVFTGSSATESKNGIGRNGNVCVSVEHMTPFTSPIFDFQRSYDSDYDSVYKQREKG